MGNSLPLPCVRHHEAEGSAAAGAKRWRRKQRSRPARRNVRAARPWHVVPVVDMPAEDGGDGGVEEREGFKDAWLPGCHVEQQAGGFGEVRRVKIVMRRKDIAELVARLEQRDAAERNAVVMEAAELNAGLGGYGEGSVSDGSRGGSVSMSPCRDAWRPRLSIIPENF